MAARRPDPRPTPKTLTADDLTSRITGDPLAEIAAEMTGEIHGLREALAHHDAQINRALRRRPADTAESLATRYRAHAVIAVAALVAVAVVASLWLALALGHGS